MMKDVFDIVNEKDEIIGQTERSEAHAKGLMHRASHVWIFNKKGEFLLQKRSAGKDTCPNMWTSSVCGHVDAGESYEDAAVREIIEEIGLEEAPTIKEIGYEKAVPETAMEFTKLYIAKSEGPFRFPEDEISELRWVSIEEMDRMILEEGETVAGVLKYLWSKKYYQKL